MPSQLWGGRAEEGEGGREGREGGEREGGGEGREGREGREAPPTLEQTWLHKWPSLAPIVHTARLPRNIPGPFSSRLESVSSHRTRG